MRGSLPGPTIKAALVLGFGLTLGLWLFTGYRFTQGIAEVEREATAIGTRYMRAQELLSSVRAQILLSSVYVRDALLDPAPGATTSYRRSLEETYRSIDQGLESYVPVLDSAAERAQVERLRQEIDNLRTTARSVLTADRLRTSLGVRELLNGQVVPKRAAAILVSEELQALNRAAFIQQQAAIAAIHRAAERQTWLGLGLALAVTLGIALLATLYTGRLETRLRNQSESLQRLSSKMVTVQEVQRRHIARELHDEVGQALTAIKVDLAVAERSLDPKGEPATLLASAQSIADVALQSVRDLSHLLHPALLDDLGLPAAVEWYVRSFERRHHIKVDFRPFEMADRLTPEIEIAAYRIVQEALTNVAKHALASTCRVTMRRARGVVEMHIDDDGTGFEILQDTDKRGLGLISMRERAAELNGTVTVTSRRGVGTRVHVVLPATLRSYLGTEEAAPQDPSAAPEVQHG